MEEYIFLKSIAGPGVKYNKGSVVSLDSETAASYIKNGIVVLYDDYVADQKAKAKKKAAALAKVAKAAKAQAAKIAKEEEAAQKAKEEAAAAE